MPYIKVNSFDKPIIVVRYNVGKTQKSFHPLLTTEDISKNKLDKSITKFMKLW
jgi:hypothetical protein